MKNLIFLLIVIFAGCHHYHESSEAAHASNVITVDSALIQKDLTARASVKEFYASRDFKLFWTVNGTTTTLTDSMVQRIRDTQQWGLIPEDYHLVEIDKLLQDSLSADKVSRLDILLTDSYLSLQHHLKYGRLDPASLQRSDLAALPDAEAIRSLRDLANNSTSLTLHLQEPEAVPYQLLKRALRNFTLEEKNDSSQRQKARSIALNMERWRWEKPLPERYVSVNIPGYVMRVFEKDSVWLASKVIVGKRETPTPVLEGVIRSFIIYPYWHAPHSIATREILPALQADSSYLRRNNFEVLDKAGTVVDSRNLRWGEYNAGNFPFILRQREGFENSMGIIKFNFTNRYGVYLHDTNSRRLFGRARRDFSHGCVRVQEAVSLARYLVREDDVYVSPEDLDQYLSLQQRLTIELRKPIPVKLQYFTCEVEQGVVRFYEDIYKKDSVMMEAIYGSKMTQSGGIVKN